MTLIIKAKTVEQAEAFCKKHGIEPIESSKSWCRDNIIVKADCTVDAANEWMAEDFAVAPPYPMGSLLFFRE